MSEINLYIRIYLINNNITQFTINLYTLTVYNSTI